MTYFVCYEFVNLRIYKQFRSVYTSAPNQEGQFSEKRWLINSFVTHHKQTAVSQKIIHLPTQNQDIWTPNEQANAMIHRIN